MTLFNANFFWPVRGGRIAVGLVDDHHGVGRAQAWLVGVATGKLLEEVDGGLFGPGMLTGAF